MNSRARSFRFASEVALVAALLLIAAVLTAAPSAAKAPAKDLVATGEHRGYTNDELYLRLDNGKEMSFLVRIPGDTEEKWHHDFEMFSRIAVTYHHEAGEKRGIVTAIKSVPK